MTQILSSSDLKSISFGKLVMLVDTPLQSEQDRIQLNQFVPSFPFVNPIYTHTYMQLKPFPISVFDAVHSN